MSEWVTDSLGQLVTFQKGRKVETSSYPMPGFAAYLGAGALSGGAGEFASTFLAVTADKNDVLMLWDGERSGLVGHNLTGVVSSTVSKLTSNGKVSSTLLYYLLLLNFEWVQNRRTGTGIPHVPKDIGRILKLSYPKSKKVQIKISTILETIDRAIEKTESLIEKYQQIKAGLMHDLFTRGIGADGKLRPPREQAPELYKETPIGWIPREWKVKSIMEVIDFPSGQVSPVVQPYIDWILVAPDHIERNTGRLLEQVTAREQGAISGKYVFEKGDIVYSKIRPYLRKAILADFGGLCSADMYPLKVRAGNNPAYVFGIILGDSFSKYADSVSMRSGFPKINRTEFSGFDCGIPSLEEQNLVANAISAIGEKLATNGSFLGKLKQHKHALMHDLLTGKTPVNADQPEPAHV